LEEDEVGSLVEHITMNCAGLEFVGLMTIGKLGTTATRIQAPLGSTAEAKDTCLSAT
jgi:uncharacterized pyridoxal phosphate-containing UPF0001 family protein